MLLWIALGVVIVASVAAIAAGPLMSRVEQPKYKVVDASGRIEVRTYVPMVIAEVEVTGERRSAIEEGFQRIAAYIFGRNASGAKIAMTAPVAQQAVGAQQWTVSFVMPVQYSLATLPAPADSGVRLVPVPARRLIVITFRGTATTEVIAAKTRELRDYAASKGIKVTGEPLLAFYNPPWTLPILRRNEVLLAIGD